MPSSQPSQIHTILELILFTDPQSMLDVGTGFGKYGFLAREYLELWDGREQYSNWTRRIDGIEAYRGYLTPIHSFIYDCIHIGNALDVLPDLEIKYDLLLLIDVLEDLDVGQGVRLLAMCREHGKNVIVSTPKDIGVMKDAFGNPYETHKFQWTARHFLDFPNSLIIRDPYSIICYLGENASRLKRAKINRWAGRLFPFLIPLVKSIQHRKTT